MKTNDCYDRATIMSAFPGVEERKAFNSAGGGVVLMLLEENTYGYANAIQKTQRELWMQFNPTASAENAALRTVRPVLVFLQRRNAGCYTFLGQVQFLRSIPGTDFFAFGLDPSVDLDLFS